MLWHFFRYCNSRWLFMEFHVLHLLKKDADMQVWKLLLINVSWIPDRFRPPIVHFPSTNHPHARTGRAGPRRPAQKIKFVCRDYGTLLFKYSWYKVSIETVKSKSPQIIKISDDQRKSFKREFRSRVPLSLNNFLQCNKMHSQKCSDSAPQSALHEKNLGKCDLEIPRL